MFVLHVIVVFMTCVIVKQHLVLKDMVNEFVEGIKTSLLLLLLLLFRGGGYDIWLAGPSQLVEKERNQKPSRIPSL